jgi:hypothetical protein
MKRFLVPLVSVVTAVAVGVASALIAIQLTGPDTPSTVQAPILAPSTIDGVAAPGLEESSGLSRITGEATVVDPTTVSADADPLPDDVAAAVAALDGSDGADGATLRNAVVRSRAGTTAGGGTDDPCAAGTPSDEAECPDGLHSIIFADTYIPEIEMYFSAGASTDPTGLSVYCSPDDTTGDGLLFDVATTIPATITLSMWPEDNPSVVTEVVLESPAAHEAAWRRAGGNSTNRYVDTELFQHCHELTGLRENSTYMGVATATDIFSRVSRIFTTRFNSAGPTTAPALEVVPLTANLLYASVPYDVRYGVPEVRAWAVADGDPADCSNYGGPTAQLREFQPQRTVPISTEYLERNNYDPNYRSRVSNIYTVPEGSTIVVCTRTFATAAPSWDADAPVRQQFVSLETPDQIVPIVKLERVDYTRDTDPATIAIGVSNQSGVTCEPSGIASSFDLPAAAQPVGTHENFDKVICDPRAHSSRRASQGFGNRLVVTTQVYVSSTELLNSSYVLNLAPYACTGDCELPRTVGYHIPLARTYIQRRLESCGNPFGCDYPPMPDGSTGTAHISVSWAHGNVNGRSDWSRSEVDSTLPDTDVPDYPQLDYNNLVTPGLSADGFSGIAEFSLRVDRAVDYTVSLSGACFEDGARREATGHVAANYPIAIFFNGLCPGSQYETTVELVGDDGTRAVYSRTRLADYWHAWYGTFSVPQKSVYVELSIELRSTTYRNVHWWTSGADATIDENRLTMDTNFAKTCFADIAETGGTRTFASSIPAERTFHLSARAGIVTEAGYYGVNHDDDCSWPSPLWRFINLDVDVPYDRLVRGVSYVQSLDGEYLMIVTARARELGTAIER